MLNIVIFGAPGAGKGTQSDFLVERYGLIHISTGDMLREEIKSGSAIGLKAKELIDNGQFVPDEIVIEMVGNQIEKNRDCAGFIFDGFPRNILQADKLKEMLSNIGQRVNYMLDLEVEQEQLIERLLERGRAKGRADDNIETITRRLQIYHQTTEPLIDYYKEEGVYHIVPNNTTVEDCTALIKSIIETI